MPTYTYECPQCGEFEVVRGINDKPLDKCDKCGNEVKRIYKTINVDLNFKGSYNSTRK